MGYEHVVYNSCLFMGGLIYQVDTLHFIPAISNIAAVFRSENLVQSEVNDEGRLTHVT